MNYLSRWNATLLTSIHAVLLAAVIPAFGVPATVSLQNLVQTYDGNPKFPTVVTDPPGLSVSLQYVETVYNNAANPLAPSYASLSFSSQPTCGLGDRVQLAGASRNLTSVDVVLVTWAKATNYLALAAADPTGWHHPVKLSVFGMDAGGNLSLSSEITNSIFVPWRPLTSSTGGPYNYNGCAFLAHFDFPTGIVLPEKPVFMVSYNTQSSGFEPIGTAGPYNELNVALASGPTVGTDDNPSASLWVRNVNSATSWIYPAIGTKAPMMIVKASRAPDPGIPPVNAGSWQVVAKIDDLIYGGEANALLTVQPAPAQVVLGSLTQVADGTPKSASITTVPAGIATNVTYGGTSNPPSLLGSYAVHATIQDPNYSGSAEGELRLGQNLTSWISSWVQNGSINAAQMGDHDDPDHDGMDNLLEYALGLNPSSAMIPGLSSTGNPLAEHSGQTLALVYRKNLAATDLDFQVETTTQLGSTATWQTAVTEDSIVATDGSTQIIRATLTPSQGDGHRFLRLSVTRH